MLHHLSITNFAIISQLQLDLTAGFSVLTGETGAGKSIVVDAISLLIGAQADDAFIKNDAPFAELEGTFRIDPNQIPEDLHYLLEAETAIIYRKITRTGTNQVRINNRSVTIKNLKRFTNLLVNIAGQHDYQTLFDRDHQRQFVDQNAGTSFEGVMKDYQTHYQSYTALLNEKHKLDTIDSDVQQRIEFLEFQIADIHHHGLNPNEDTELESIRKTVMAGEKTKQSFTDAESHLATATESLSRCQSSVTKLSEYNTDISKFPESLHNIELELTEILNTLKAKHRDILAQSNRSIDDIESRLDQLFKLKTKYRANTINDLLNRLNDLETELNTLKKRESRSDEIDTQISKLDTILSQHSDRLRTLRVETSNTLSAAVSTHMSKLGLPHAKLHIAIDPCETFTPWGKDTVTFMISTNPGSPLQRLEKIASGGELSRILLAIKSEFHQTHQYATLIFDEIDTGVGGTTANTIGEMLQSISVGTQVLCVTHLAQIAKHATHHFKVQKMINTTSVDTQVTQLKENDRPIEFERMIGGKDVLNAISPN